MQHKVPSYAKHRVGNNKRFYDSHGGPYFRFKVDKDQHNTMVHSMYNANIFYCTPLFSTHEDLKTKFNQNHINNSSIWIDPSNITISDNNTHNITYDKFGMDVYLHSQPTFLKTIQFKNPKEILTKRIIDKRYVEQLLENLQESLSNDKYQEINKGSLSKKLTNMERTQNILGKVYKMSWILL